MRHRKILLGTFVLAALATIAYAAGTLLLVQVESAQVRTQPHYFLGKKLTVLKYGDKVESLETQGTWTKIRCADGQIGWVSTDSLVSEAVQLKAGDKDANTRANAEEMALAGRGFNNAVEDQYKRTNAKLDYAWVDRMEKDPAFVVSTEEMLEFLRAGGLLPQEGGAQ